MVKREKALKSRKVEWKKYIQYGNTTRKNKKPVIPTCNQKLKSNA